MYVKIFISQKFRFSKSSALIGLSSEDSLTGFAHKNWGDAAPGESLRVLSKLRRIVMLKNRKILGRRSCFEDLRN